MKSDHFFHHWKYLGLEQKQHYQKNQFYSMLIVTGLVVLALALSVVWPERVVPVPSTPGGDGTGRATVGQYGGISKALQSSGAPNYAAMSLASALLPSNLSRSGYIPRIMVLKDTPEVAASIMSVTPEYAHQLATMAGPALDEDERELFTSLDHHYWDCVLDDYDDLLPPEKPYLPEIQAPAWNTSDGGSLRKGTIALAPFFWPRYIDTTVGGTVTLLVTVPASKLKPKSYRVLVDDAGFGYAVKDMLDRSRVRPPEFEGERITVTVQWTFLVCWRCEQVFASSEGLFETIR